MSSTLVETGPDGDIVDGDNKIPCRSTAEGKARVYGRKLVEYPRFPSLEVARRLSRYRSGYNLRLNRV